MKSRNFDLETDYEMIQSWAESRGLNRVPRSRLSTYGLLVEKEDMPVAACFLFPFMGSQMCMMEFLIANPAATASERSEATELVFLEISKMARALGFKEILTTSYLSSVSSKLEDMGFIKNNDLVNHYIGRLV